ncbi:MAG: hypothetical protein HGA78_12505 [Nitrospirales bacterium]|nr:hypothetical protein [Nitrospirales bacterium]
MKLWKVLGSATLTSMLLFGAAYADPQDVVVKLKDKTITLADVERIVNYQGIWKLKAPEAADYSVREAILNRVVRAKVISDIARAKGFDKRQDIKEEMAMIANDLLAQEYLRAEIIDKVELTDADVRKYYDDNINNFKIPQMIKARHILISQNIPGKTPEEASEKAKAKAEEVLQRIKAGEDFAKVASEISDDTATKVNGGDLGIFPKGKMVKEFEEPAFSLKKGELSGIVKTMYGFHIIKVEEVVEGKIEPFENVMNQLKEKAFMEKRKATLEKFIDDSLKEAGLEMNLQVLQANSPKQEVPVPRH